MFQLLNGISRSGSLIVKRGIKKYARGLIIRFFGWLRGPNSPQSPLDLPWDAPGPRQGGLRSPPPRGSPPGLPSPTHIQPRALFHSASLRLRYATLRYLVPKAHTPQGGGLEFLWKYVQQVEEL